jgi:uncharacterized protein YabN with tetrapyrrole methylase and pyrophosphatase domain
LSGQTDYVNNNLKSEELKKPSNKKGSLRIVGSGFQAVLHLTFESKMIIERSDKVLYLVNDPVSELWIKKMNPNSESLKALYLGGKCRADTYKEMTELTLRYVREGLNVCVVYYGHPGVFVTPSHESIKLARAEGFNARMLPGISAEDCLFADLGIDPGTRGCQSFEATDFLLNRRKFDTGSHLILWQIGGIGDFTYDPDRDNKRSLTIMVDFLEKYYDQQHEAYIYQAAEYAICKPIIQHLPLSKLATEGLVNYASTLYVPPKTSYVAKGDYNMAHKLGIYEQLKPTDIHFSIKKLFHLKDRK